MITTLRMDIRNINVEPLQVDQSQYLEKMYELGKDQLKGYLVIEGLPNPPLDINPPKSQVILKDFIGRIIEELSEGYESTSEVCDLMEAKGWNMYKIDDSTYKQLLNSLQNANEEQADAIGFFITLLLYSNILPEDIYSYIRIHHRDDEDLSIYDAMVYGLTLIMANKNFEELQRVKHLYTLFDEKLAKEYGINFDKVYSYTPGFREMSQEFHSDEPHHLWLITHQLNIARNILKNRPWKQTQMMSKELDYQEAIVKAFIMYLGYLALNGFTPRTLFDLFYRKQQLNLWRQSTGY